MPFENVASIASDSMVPIGIFIASSVCAMFTFILAVPLGSTRNQEQGRGQGQGQGLDSKESDENQRFPDNGSTSTFYDSSVNKTEIVVRFPWEPVTEPVTDTVTDIAATIPADFQPIQQHTTCHIIGPLNVPRGAQVFTSGTRQGDTGRIKRKKTSQVQHHQQQQQEQLDFLATMTFGGGGLRQPFCPCCR